MLRTASLVSRVARLVQLPACRAASTAAAAAPAPAAAAAAAAPPAGNTPGSLWLWGAGTDARMGMAPPKPTGIAGLRGNRLAPTPNPHVRNVKQIVCRAGKTLMLTHDGSVYAWGSCPSFSLGHGAGVETQRGPKKIEALAGIKIVQIDAGETSSAAVSADGDLFTWGWAGSWWRGDGGLGHGTNLTQPRPALVDAFASAGVKVGSVAVGNGHMYALTTSGQVWSWGNGEYGRCGNGKKKQGVPEPVELLADKRVISLASGAQHGLAVTASGHVWAWGKNDSGQLGVGGSVLMDLNTMEEYPLAVELEETDDGAEGFNGKVVAVAAGGNHSLALTKEGRVFQWGQRTFLQPQEVTHGYVAAAKSGKDEEAAGAGAGEEEDEEDPKAGNGIRIKAVAVAAGEGVSGVIQENGDVYTWGKNLNTGMLGHTLYGTGTRRPYRVGALHAASAKAASISFGSKHAGAVIGAPPVRPTLPFA